MYNHGDHNSRIEIFLGVIRNLLDDIATLIESSPALRDSMSHLNPRRETQRDMCYIESRVRHEGIEFLTVALPKLGKWYDDRLAAREGVMIEGFKPSFSFSGFPGMHTCPLFVRMYAYTICAESVTLQERAAVITAYRSLLFLLYKLEVPITDELQEEALKSWKSNEQELEDFLVPEYYDRLVIEVRQLIADLFFECGRDQETRIFRDLRPRHGPGAVAGGENNEEKWETINLIPSLHSVYPRYDLYFGVRSSGRISPPIAGEIISMVKKSRVTESVSRLLFVPKDSRGPRVISCEPKELMFVQQGVGRNLMQVLHQNSGGRINFVDQSINGQLALRASKDNSFATIDLKDASDRVATWHITHLFPHWAQKYMFALRSEKTLLPNGDLVSHRKYAPMGSALCFPVESLIFWSIAVCAGITAGMSREEAIADTYVYGDDIIIRPSVYEEFLEYCRHFGIKVNESKSFVSGPFRESCGVDAWMGMNVTPFRIKKDISHRSPDGRLATAICKYSSRCFARDFRKTGEYLFKLVDRHYPGVLVHDAPLACLSVVDPLNPIDLSDYRTGWDPRACYGWVQGWVLTTPNEPSHLSGLSRLLKNLYGDWGEHDPSRVALLNRAKIRKRKVLVERW